MSIARPPPPEILEQVPQSQRKVAQSYQEEESYQRVESQA
jgi:hypothetical protein